jgi:hypothetical protein
MKFLMAMTSHTVESPAVSKDRGIAQANTAMALRSDVLRFVPPTFT